MTRAQINRFTGLLPLLLSLLAFAIVMANILAGARPQSDENASAHLWQLLMVSQLPLILLFIATADWRSRATALLIGLQLLGIVLACLPVWLAGY
jgi:uncharacterized membrane protein